MTDDALPADPEAELDPDEEVPLLSQHARFGVTLGTQFTYRGQSHWPKVSIEDGPLIVDGTTEDDQDVMVVEDGEELIYRVTELAHRTLGATIARMRAEIDTRYAEDQAARTAATPPAQPTEG